MEPININSSSEKEDIISKNITYNEMDNTMKIYRAVIENNKSPKKDGRVQVRIFGIHDERLEKIKTEHLPWAEVMQSTAFGFNTGIGFSSIPNIGTWVFVILDHNNPNLPIVIGAISGKPVEPADPSKGFNDPLKIYPLDGDLPENSTCQGPHRLNEEDQNRLQRVENLDKTIHKKINDTLDKQYNITDEQTVSGPTISGQIHTDVSQVEPDSLSDRAEYPYNSVLETRNGHVIEVDDTPYNERIRMYHKSGSYFEVRPDGSFIMKGVNNDSVSHFIHMNDIQEHIAKGVKRYVEDNIEEIINKSVKRNIKQNLQEHINGDLHLKVDGNVIWEIGGKIDIKSGGTQTNVNGGNYTHIAPRIDLNP